MPRKGDSEGRSTAGAPAPAHASPHYMLWTFQALVAQLREVRDMSGLERVLGEAETALRQHEAAKVAFPEVYFGAIESHLVRMNNSLDRIVAALERATGIAV